MSAIVLKWNKLLPTTIDVGWRVQYEDGFVDMMWGNTRDDESLKLLLKDIERHYGKKEVIDCRKNAT